MTLDLILIGVAITLDPLPLTAYILLVASKGGTSQGRRVPSRLACLPRGDYRGDSAAHRRQAAAAQHCAVDVRPGRADRCRCRAARAGVATASAHRAPEGGTRMAEEHRQGQRPGRGGDRRPAPAVGDGRRRCGVGVAGGSVEGSGITAIIVYVVIASSSYLVMQAYVMARPEAAMRRLQGLNNWIDAHRDPAVIILFSLLGVWLIGRGTVRAVLICDVGLSDTHRGARPCRR